MNEEEEGDEAKVQIKFQFLKLHSLPLPLFILHSNLQSIFGY